MNLHPKVTNITGWNKSLKDAPNNLQRKRHLESFKLYLIENKIACTSWEHQWQFVPIFDTGYCVLLSLHEWSKMMQNVWNTIEPTEKYNYTDFIMVDPVIERLRIDNHGFDELKYTKEVKKDTRRK